MNEEFLSQLTSALNTIESPLVTHEIRVQASQYIDQIIHERDLVRYLHYILTNTSNEYSISLRFMAIKILELWIYKWF